MPSFSQYGGAMNDSLPQQDAHSAPCAPTGSRQAGHSGGKATPSATPSTRCKARDQRARPFPSTGSESDAVPMPQRSAESVGAQRRPAALTRSRAKLIWGVEQPMPPIVFDRAAVRRNLRRAQKLGPATFLIDRAAEELGERLTAVLREFERAVDLASPTDAVRRTLRESRLVSSIVALDEIADRATGDALRIVGDAEALPFRENSLDLVVSALALHLVNDLPGTFIQVCRALKPDGLFLAALLGGDTLVELRQAFAAAETEVEHGVSPRVAPFSDVRAIGMLLQRAGFALPVVDVEKLTVRYDSPFALLRDLRRMGAANALAERR